MGDRIVIQYIEVPEVNRRNGIARSLVNQLKKDNPDAKIEWGMLTDDGAKLKEAIEQTEAKGNVAVVQETPKVTNVQWFARAAMKNPILETENITGATPEDIVAQGIEFYNRELLGEKSIQSAL